MSVRALVRFQHKMVHFYFIINLGNDVVFAETAANQFGTQYWPPPYGIIRTPWKQWIAQAKNASDHVSVSVFCFWDFVSVYPNDIRDAVPAFS